VHVGSGPVKNLIKNILKYSGTTLNNTLSSIHQTIFNAMSFNLIFARQKLKKVMIYWQDINTLDITNKASQEMKFSIFNYHID
jgi:DNA polymerase III delta subunit